MKEENQYLQAATYLSSMISASDAEARYDEYQKLILADRQIISWILSGCVREYRGLDPEAVQRCIDGEVQVSSVPLRPEEAAVRRRRADRKEGLAQEMRSPGEGTVTFDIRFRINLPEGSSPRDMQINLEGQGVFSPGYPLPSRGVFYGARMLSSQMGELFEPPHYGELRKAASIWVCFRPPKQMQSRIISYEMMPHPLFGEKPDPQLHGYDLLTVILICLNDGTKEQHSGNALIDRLSIIFSECLSAEEKIKILKDQYHVQLSREVEERSAEMTGSGALIREDAYRSGCEDGRAQGQAEGLSQGFAQGRLKTFFELVTAGLLSPKDAAAMLQMTEDAFRAQAEDSGCPLP